MGFVHLHLHTEYSLLDGACRISSVFETAKKLGQSAVAITDHGVMYGVIDFYKQAKAAGIKPIIGCEVYVANRTRFDKVFKLDHNSHLVLLCKNETGYKNLIKLVSLGFTEGFYSKPRVDREILRKYSDGLIALSACLSGEIPRMLLSGDCEGAKKAALEYRDIFGEGNFYIEIQDHSLDEEKRILPLLCKLSDETGIPLAATNDCHYISRDDSKIQKVLLCVQTGNTIYEDNALAFATDEFYMKSEDEMRALFPARPDALENTVKIAEMCDLDFEFGVYKIPFFSTGEETDNPSYLRKMAEEGLIRRYGETPSKTLTERLDYELGIITKMGYVDYYLIVYDFIRYAKSKGIAVGPGRGSGAASIVAYCIGITDIDPIKYNLLFERFLNPERVSMPDFDVDFCYERRGEVIDYVIRRYGEEKVAQIITFGTLAARAAVKDVGRVLTIPYQTADAVSKLITAETIDKALSASSELRTMYDTDEKIRELIDTSRKVEGMPRHASTHAAAVVISRNPIDTYVPVQTNGDSIVTQFPMTTIEELGLLKMDFLGLRTLTVISDAEKMVRLKLPDFSVNAIPEDDKKTFEMLSAGNTEGVFQFESEGMKRVLSGLGPESVEDLIAVISLYRPGPMDSIETYIDNRKHPEKISYKHPLLKDILDVTNGCIVYQEQVMQICRKLAGFSYGRADLVRRAMAKKKPEVLERERDSFIHGAKNPDGSVACVGAIANGVPETVANEIFDQMSSFASYAFNKAHAAAYAIVSYRTAYLKAHYPLEYMSALLTSVLDNTDKVTGYIAECQKLGIRVLPPTVNDSFSGFVAEGKCIRFGLLAIKNLGRSFIDAMITERASSPFLSFKDFCERMLSSGFNRRSVESLIKSGAFDSFGINRHTLIENSDSLISGLEDDRRSNLEGQLDFFGETGASHGEFTFKPETEYPARELLAMEKEITGLYLSGHPLDEYPELCKNPEFSSIGDMYADDDAPSVIPDGARVKLFAVILSKSVKTTKNGDNMAFLMLEDKTGPLEAVVFPRVFSEAARFTEPGQAIAVYGKASVSRDEPPKFTCEKILPASRADELFSLKKTGVSAPSGPRESPSRPLGAAKLCLCVPSEKERAFERVKSLLYVFSGNTPVYILFNDTGKKVIAPPELYVEINDTLMNELKRELGNNNAILET